MELGRAQKKVCVTGGSGFIASWLVKLLLQRGYIVHATVRSLDDPAKTEHLLALDGGKEKLHLFEANLTEEGSFDSAIQGCDGVFHTASPVLMDSSNPQVDIVDPAVKGTLNVLASCARAPTVKRVVFTSSNATVILRGRPFTHETVVDETWFSTPEACMTYTAPWYCLSKTLAEEAAWKFSKEKGIDMVVIIPGLVIGPFLDPKLNLGASFVLTWVNGSTTKLDLNKPLWWVHVKDVAEAHIQAFENPLANGRYNMAERVAHPSEALKILDELYPNTFTLPTVCTGDQPLEPNYKVSKDKIRSLGINYIPLEDGLRETVECLREKKFVSF